MKRLYDRPTLEEYMAICQEEKDYKRIGLLLERHGEFEEARCVRTELRFIEIKKICYKAALRVETKRKAAARSMQTA